MWWVTVWREVFPTLNMDDYKSYVWSTILYGSEAWCLKESEMGILWRTERSMLRVAFWIKLKNRMRTGDFMLMLGWNETPDQLAIAKNICWYGHVLRRVDAFILTRTLDFAVEGQIKKWRPMRTWRKEVEKESVKVGLRMEDALCRSKWSVGANQIAIRLRWIWPPWQFYQPSLHSVLTDQWSASELKLCPTCQLPYVKKAFVSNNCCLLYVKFWRKVTLILILLPKHNLKKYNYNLSMTLNKISQLKHKSTRLVLFFPISVFYVLIITRFSCVGQKGCTYSMGATCLRYAIDLNAICKDENAHILTRL